VVFTPVTDSGNRVGVKSLLPMKDHEPITLIERVRRWLRPVDRDEEYLAAAVNHADLERRIRILERGAGGPQFVTFNH
jgi:hypothetical protein